MEGDAADFCIPEEPGERPAPPAGVVCAVDAPLTFEPPVEVLLRPADGLAADFDVFGVAL